MGIRFFVIALTLIFITLKLTEQIFWAWIWVLSPLWISLVTIAVVFIVGMLAAIWFAYFNTETNKTFWTYKGKK